MCNILSADYYATARLETRKAAWHSERETMRSRRSGGRLNRGEDRRKETDIQVLQFGLACMTLVENMPHYVHSQSSKPLSVLGQEASMI